MYLLDANVLIAANAYFYPLDRIPQFWVWLIEKGNNGNIKIPPEIHAEIAAGDDELAQWIKKSNVKDALILSDILPPYLVQQTLNEGYAPDLDETEIEKIGRDVFLVAYAYFNDERTVVTREVSASSRKRGNTKIPDACDKLGVKWTDDFKMYRSLNFNLKGR